MSNGNIPFSVEHFSLQIHFSQLYIPLILLCDLKLAMPNGKKTFSVKHFSLRIHFSPEVKTGDLEKVALS